MVSGQAATVNAAIDETQRSSHMTKDREVGQIEKPREKLPYEAPRITRKRSLTRAVLFSGGATTGTASSGAAASGLTADG